MGFYTQHLEDKFFLPVEKLSEVYDALRRYDAQIVANGYQSDLRDPKNWDRDILDTVAHNKGWDIVRDE